VHRRPRQRAKKHTRTQWSKSGDELQGNARETRPEPERNQTPNATANRKTHKKAKPPQMPESHTPEPHKPAAHARKLRAVFCLGRIVSASVGGLFALLLFILQ
jgi:hypothetical protein